MLYDINVEYKKKHRTDIDLRFIKKKTITLKTPKTIKVKVGKKITGKISLKKDK